MYEMSDVAGHCLFQVAPHCLLVTWCHADIAPVVEVLSEKKTKKNFPFSPLPFLLQYEVSWKLGTWDLPAPRLPEDESGVPGAGQGRDSGASLGPNQCIYG